jgi:hypothetical protein
MPYISRDGTLVQHRSPWRLSIITDYIFALINMIWIFLQTLIDDPRPSAQRGGVSGGRIRDNRTLQQRNRNNGTRQGSNIMGMGDLSKGSDCAGGS